MLEKKKQRQKILEEKTEIKRCQRKKREIENTRGENRDKKMLEEKTEIEHARGKTEIENAGGGKRDRTYQRRKQR